MMRKTFTSIVLLFLFITVVGAQPVLIKEIPTKSKNFTKVGNTVFFISGDSLMKTDGTPAGTVLVKNGLELPSNLMEFNGLLYFLNDSITDPQYSWLFQWKSLWRSDGTAAGTYKLKESDIGNVNSLKGYGNYLYFSTVDATTGREQYRTDGTVAGTILLKDIFTGASSGLENNYYSSIGAGNYFYFQATDASHGTELWKSDGTPAGTTLVKDIIPGPASGLPGYVPMREYNNLLIFVANDGANGVEPWLSDGTESGTFMLKDITPGAEGSTIEFIGSETLNGNFYFTSSNSEGYKLWKSNGTPSGTIMVKSFDDDPYPEVSAGLSIVYKNKLYFFIKKYYVTESLWATDGTESGTQLIKDQTTIDGGTEFLKIVNDYMVFYGNNQGYYSTLYKSDGTTAGTTALYSFSSSDGPTKPVVLGNLLFFADNDGPSYYGYPDNPDDYYQLMQSDVKAGTTKSLRSIFGTSFEGSNNLVNFNGKLLFTTFHPYKPGDKMRLWIYDPFNVSNGAPYFTLVNATTDQDIRSLHENDTIFYNFSADQITIRANPDQAVGSIVFKLNGAIAMKESKAPYALKGDNNGDYHPWAASYGYYTLTATSYTGPGGTGTELEEKTIHFRVLEVPSEITFTLVNAETDTDVGPLTNGQTIDLSAIGTSKLNVRANSTLTGTESVVFDFGGISNFKTENAAPYALFGDNNGDYLSYYKFTPGTYTLGATPYTQDNGSGTSGKKLNITFKVVQGNAPVASGIRTYPNPVSDNLKISSDTESATTTEIVIYDQQGNEFYKGNHEFGTGEAQINLANVVMPRGIYFVKLHSQENVRVVKIYKD